MRNDRQMQKKGQEGVAVASRSPEEMLLRRRGAEPGQAPATMVVAALAAVDEGRGWWVELGSLPIARAIFAMSRAFRSSPRHFSGFRCINVYLVA